MPDFRDSGNPGKRRYNSQALLAEKGVRALYFKETLDIKVLSKIRHCAATGLVLGTDSFRAQVQKLRN